jgi:hypothetical protein
LICVPHVRRGRIGNPVLSVAHFKRAELDHSSKAARPLQKSGFIMPTKQDFESLPLIELAVLCKRVADDPSRYTETATNEAGKLAKQCASSRLARIFQCLAVPRQQEIGICSFAKWLK